ncbi:type VI secretion system Vgr family protein [Pseudoduganella violaceinigra]|uniref:type VI secretion system Vgr family protein n=1 Tax=Pseudoduganella violaceinigra TaxID=246602 RepID=UPI00040AA3FA|nr:type VI secretion system tip protein VgrG [Pseudoduganella violaceinigra]
MSRSGLALKLSAAPELESLQLVALHGEEALAELFHYALELYSSNTALDLAGMVGKPVTASVALPDGGWRHFSGKVARIVQAGGGTEGAVYRADLRPWLWWLTLEADARIFQNKSVPDIITGLFQEYGFNDFRNSLTASYTEREYCVQYNETTFAFISRLMEEEGIFYSFEHTASGHTLVLLDGGEAYPACTGLTTATCVGSSSSRERPDLVFRCDAEQSAVPGRYASGDFSFMTPAEPLAASAGAQAGGRIYEYPGGYSDNGAGQAFAKLRMQALGQEAQSLRGDSSCRAFTSGCKFTLAGHARSELNAEHVLRRVVHSISQDGYSNSFVAFPVSLPFRPPLVTPRARVPGTQTATVVGKSGEEIWTDSYGRIKVQFHWDRLGKNDENSSCWVRVAQAWAGQAWGAFFLPRIGQEVIVSFLDGDPDRPLVTGSVYNATQTVPDGLPANQTRSTIRSRSSKQGSAGNELRFEDKKDSEELYLHAQKDMKTEVENDRSARIIKGNESLKVEQGTRTVDVKGDESHVNQANFEQKVTGNFTLKVDGDLTIEVAGAVSIKAGSTFKNEAGTELTNQAGTALNNKAGTELTNKAGTTLTNDAGVSMTNKAAASQTVDGGGMLTLKGGIVKIN